MKKTQKQMFYDAQKTNTQLMRQFNDIMNSNNPLTKKEIKELYNKRPSLYYFLVQEDDFFGDVVDAGDKRVGVVEMAESGEVEFG